MFKKIANCLIVTIFSSLLSYSQTHVQISNDLFGRRVFIENNGQFDDLVQNKKISYAYLNGDEQVYFNEKGLTYLLQKYVPLSEHDKERMEHGKEVRYKPSKKCFIHVNWLNANENIQIVESEKQSYYHSFGDAKFKSDCFKKITYKNVYDHIDIEYLISDERLDGIKYNVIIHPGGNIDQVKINYSGDLNKLSIKEGKVIVKNDILDFMELPPVAFQQDKKIECNFIIDENTISFQLPGEYNHTEDLIIDPWVTNLTTNNVNCGFDVDYDYEGNYYVYGGNGPYLIAKYSTDGTLLWVFDGVVPSQNWSSAEQYKIPGNFVVEKMTGEIYVGEGLNNDIGVRIIRLDENGLYDNFISTASIDLHEIWSMDYYCPTGKVFCLGGSVFTKYTAGNLDIVTGELIPQTFTTYTDAGQDVVANTIDPSGTVFFIFAAGLVSQLNNAIMKVNGSFNGYDWLQPTNYYSLSEGANKFAYPGIPQTDGSNGYNAIVANEDYLYYYDGRNLASYNKSTGAQIASIVVPDQTEMQQGGIDVDGNNNIYVGGNGFIHCFNFNGTTFSTVGNIPITSSGFYGNIFDLKYFSVTNSLFISGSGFGGVYNATFSTADSSDYNGCILEGQNPDPTIEGEDLDFSIETSNVFSPNNDGFNDYYYFKKLENAESLTITIYNRWGNLVYSSQNVNAKWDGKSTDGKELSNGVYFYIYEAKGKKEDQILKGQGYIHLIR